MGGWRPHRLDSVVDDAIPGLRLGRLYPGPFRRGRLSDQAIGQSPPRSRLSKNTYEGWFLGTGYEYGLGFFPGLFWKTEYRFASYDKDRVQLLFNGLPLAGEFVELRKYIPHHPQRARVALQLRRPGGRALLSKLNVPDLRKPRPLAGAFTFLPVVVAGRAQLLRIPGVQLGHWGRRWSFGPRFLSRAWLGAPMKKLAFHAAAISALLAGSASAADLRRPMPVKAPPPAVVAVYSWTGCYVGAGGGYGMFDQKTGLSRRRRPSLACRMTSAAAAGSVRCRSVATISSARTSSSAPSATMTSAASRAIWCNPAFSGVFGSSIGEEKLKSSWAAGGRIGWVPWSTQQLLVYVSGRLHRRRASAQTALRRRVQWGADGLS